MSRITNINLTNGVDRAQKFDYAFSMLNSATDIFKEWGRAYGIKTSRFDKSITSISGFTFGAYVMNCIRATKHNQTPKSFLIPSSNERTF